VVKSPLYKRVDKVLNAFDNTLADVNIICNVLSILEPLLVMIQKLNIGPVNNSKSWFEQW